MLFTIGGTSFSFLFSSTAPIFVSTRTAFFSLISAAYGRPLLFRLDHGLVRPRQRHANASRLSCTLLPAHVRVVHAPVRGLTFIIQPPSARLLQGRHRP